MEQSVALRVLDVSTLRVLVTAAGGGIGRAIAEAFHAAGARVHVTDVDAAAVQAAGAALPGLGGTAAEASDAAAADRVRDAVMERFGGLDVLINNVGATSASS